MRAAMMSLMSAVLIAVASPAVNAYDQNQAALVDSWYHRYLGRHAEPSGLAGHARRLAAGFPIESVEGGILASDEYYHRNGCNDAGFVAGVYRDVLGVAADPRQIAHGVHRLHQLGSREAFAVEFLRTAHRPVAPAAPVRTYRPQPFAPAVVPYPAYRPAYFGQPYPYGPAFAHSSAFGFGIR